MIYNLTLKKYFFTDADLSQSITSEISFAEGDESNASSFTVTDTEVSIAADDSITLEPPKKDEKEETQEPKEVPTEIVEIKKEVVEVKQEQEIKDEPEEIKTCEDTVNNLEQQISEVNLNEESAEISKDIEMKEERMEMEETVKIEEQQTEILAEEEQKVTKEVIEVKAETEIPVEVQEKITEIIEKAAEIPDNILEIMEVDDSKFVRRSRRLQSIYVEPSKIEEIAPVPAEEKPEVQIQESSYPAIVIETEDLPKPVEAPVIEDPPQKAVIVADERVPHTDKRLKRYETIRDNIYGKKSDKKVCKTNKTMKCDCTITEEEVKNGELGCTFNCINRLLYIECGTKCRCGGELQLILKAF